MSPIWLVLLLATHAEAVVPPGEEVIGDLGAHVVAPGESLIEIARAHDVGFNEIAAANPDLDPFVPRAGATAILPTSWILPAAATPGAVVVNLSEMRLFLFSRTRQPPLSFPIGVAMSSRATPLGVLTVVEKTVQPTWYPTPAILEEDPTLPAVVPPGPDNPLGSHALRLSSTRILIHGTNRPFGVGRKVSHGCVRLYPEDIPRLFALVEIGTPVVIVREPVKVGVRGGRVHVEVHEDDALPGNRVEEAVRLLEARDLLLRVHPARLVRAVRAEAGIPVDVTDDESRW